MFPKKTIDNLKNMGFEITKEVYNPYHYIKLYNEKNDFLVDIFEVPNDTYDASIVRTGDILYEGKARNIVYQINKHYKLFKIK